MFQGFFCFILFIDFGLSQIQKKNISVILDYCFATFNICMHVKSVDFCELKFLTHFVKKVLFKQKRLYVFIEMVSDQCEKVIVICVAILFIIPPKTKFQGVYRSHLTVGQL